MTDEILGLPAIHGLCSISITTSLHDQVCVQESGYLGVCQRTNFIPYNSIVTRTEAELTVRHTKLTKDLNTGRDPEQIHPIEFLKCSGLLALFFPYVLRLLPL